MVAQGVLPFEFVPETSRTTLTGLAGLPVYLDLVAVTSAASSGRARSPIYCSAPA